MTNRAFVRLVVFVGIAAAAMSCSSSVPDKVSKETRAALSAAPALGTIQSFAVLAGSTVTNTGSTVVTGDLGLSPGTAVTGFPPGLVTGGTIQAANAVAIQAQSDATAAYDALAGQACDHDLTDQDLGGLTLTPGTYCFSSSAQLTGTLTLNAQGDPAAVFIFQIGSTLTTASNSSVLINGGNLCNVYWQVGSAATLGTDTAFIGSIIALKSITLTTGAKLEGRALARDGAVTLDTNKISAGGCNAGVADAGQGGAADASVADAGPGSVPDAGPGSVADAGPGSVADAGPGSVADASVADAGPGSVADASVADAGPGSVADASVADACVGDAGPGSVADAGVADAGPGSVADAGVADAGPGSVADAGVADAGPGNGQDGGSTCEGHCVDLNTDHENCGSCGNVCAELESCVEGACIICD